jgi:hypothetical protein
MGNFSRPCGTGSLGTNTQHCVLGYFHSYLSKLVFRGSSVLNSSATTLHGSATPGSEAEGLRSHAVLLLMDV